MEEIWKDIAGYEGLYLVSDCGRVCRVGKPGGRMLSTKTSLTHPYPKVNLCKEGYRKTIKVHRLVAMAFIPNPENKPLVNHKDSNKANNHVGNLEWATRPEDALHASRSGNCMSRAGSAGGGAVLSEKEVLWLRRLHSRGTPQHVLVDLFELSKGAISMIINRKTWRHI